MANTIQILAKYSQQIRNIIDGYEEDDIKLSNVHDELSREIDLNDVLNMNIKDGIHGLSVWDFVYKYDFDNKMDYFEKIKSKLSTSQSAFFNAMENDDLSEKNISNKCLVYIKNCIKKELFNQHKYVVQEMRFDFSTLGGYEFCFNIIFNAIPLSLTYKLIVNSNSSSYPKYEFTVRVLGPNFTYDVYISAITFAFHFNDDDPKHFCNNAIMMYGENGEKNISKEIISEIVTNIVKIYKIYIDKLAAYGHKK